MARVVNCDHLFTFRFHARFWKGYAPEGDPIDLGDQGFTSMEVGAKHCGIRQTPLGLEVWTAHRVEQPMLFERLREARTVEVVLFSGGEKKSRVITMNIDKPVCLPFRLDAMDSSVAMDGVLFQETEFVSMEDEVREWPPEKPRPKEVLPGVAEEDRKKLITHGWFYQGKLWYQDGDKAGYTTEDALLKVAEETVEDGDG